MSYGSASNILPFEHASKLGHVSIINDPFIEELIESFVDVSDEKQNIEVKGIQSIGSKARQIKNLIAVDGSFATISNTQNTKKSLSYIKIASLYLNQEELEKANEPIVDPDVIRNILGKNSDVFSTVLPLNNITVKGVTPLESIRIIIEKSLKTYENEMLYDTLKYLLFRQWDVKTFKPLKFGCPFCDSEVIIDSLRDQYHCARCNKEIFLSDYLGLNMELRDDNTSESVAISFMQILEHLTMFSFIRIIYQQEPQKLGEVLFLKDGPLALYAQYSRLIPSMRDFLSYIAKEYSINVVGVEKSGVFYEHASYVETKLDSIGDFFIPDNQYIFSNIKHGDPNITKYGERVIYGAKVFMKLDETETSIFSLPLYTYTPNPRKEDIINIEDILCTLLRLKSKQFTNAILPIVAVNKIASMAMYPSNSILTRFSNSLIVKGKKEDDSKK